MYAQPSLAYLCPSPLQVYAAMLLGFLLEDSPGSRVAAARLLEGNSLAPLVSAIQRGLVFYVSTGAITDSTREMLTRLVQNLGGSGESMACMDE
jgi:hypothetical protein